MSTPLPTVSALPLDPRTYERGLSCVHCGLCLPACPTYTETLNEADSPRGRIQLMLGMADGKIEVTQSAKEHLDGCLDCRGCETACPSGVVYHEMIEETRARLLKQARQTISERVLQWIFFHVFVYPRRLKLLLLPARVLQAVGIYGLLRKVGLFKLLPARFRKMEQMLPPTGPLWPRMLPAFTPALSSSEGPDASASKAKPTIAFFPGCVGSVMFQDVNRQAVELLSACGADVVVPRGNVCCGAIHLHDGDAEQAKQFARQNIDAFLPRDGSLPKFIATNIAGCGAMLREYDVLLRDDPNYAERAKVFVSIMRDISEVLLALGLPPMKHPVRETVTYHDACHLAHAQRVTAAPRALLAAIPGLTLVALPESDICCGAAGTYNLEHPQMATQLAERKLNNIAATAAPVCAAGNVGCAMHLQSAADARGQRLRIVHPVELIHRAIFG